MQLVTVGINYQTAPLAIREKAAISPGKLADTLLQLRSHTAQGVILSTCNRTEIYSVSAGTDDNAEKAVLDFLEGILAVPHNGLPAYIYTYKNVQAAGHLFRVASGLESLIVGEYEVLGQVRQALEAAEKAKVISLPLRYSFQTAIRIGRLVREQTGISRNALSVSSVAVNLAAGIVGDLRKSSMLVVGAGEAGRLVAEVAMKKGVFRTVIASRTRERSQSLASVLNGVPVDFTALEKELRTIDLVVACSGAPHRILRFNKIETVMRKRPERPLVIIDIAVPRNVEPEVGTIKNVYLYNIDDLTEIADINRRQRESELRHAEQIISEEVDKFRCRWHNLEIKPAVGALMNMAEEIRIAQLNKTLKTLPSLSDEQRENLEAMTKSIVKRILRPPVQYLKTKGNNAHIELVRELFNLESGK